MRKVIVGAQVSMDGVMQAPGAPWEDPTKGFNFGGWVMTPVAYSAKCSSPRVIAAQGSQPSSCGPV
jgi:hypothetical protein